MILLSVVLEGSLMWSAHPDDPDLYPLDCLAEWSLVNPLMYNGIAKLKSDPAGEPTAQNAYIVKDNAHLISNGFYLVHNNDSYQFDWTNENPTEWEQKLLMLVSYFRWASKQHLISPKLRMFGPSNISTLPPIDFPEKDKECATQAWQIKTAITKDHIQLAAKQSLADSPPSYDMLLQDAIEALNHGEYKTTILFCAMAIEHLARMKLAKAFEDAFAVDDQGQALRITLLPETKMETNSVRKNEMFNFLIKNKRIRDLLHKVPLILMGKSLLTDHKDLYDATLRVYDARNRVIHKELLFKDNSLRFAGIDEAIEAVQCAIQVVGWFGEPNSYVSPFDKTHQGIICHTAKQLAQ